jgi:hypothetical protein
VSGIVVAINTDLHTRIELLDEDPHGTWIIKLKLNDPAEVETLLSSTEFAEFVRRTDEAASERKPPPPKPTPTPQPQPRAKPKPAPPPQPQAPPEPTAEEERNMMLKLLWSTRLRDRRLRGGDDAFGDRDYSGGGYFSWRQREIAFTSRYPGEGRVDRTYRWRDTRTTRVSAGGLSNTTSSHTDYSGIWNIEIIGGKPSLVLQDVDRGRLTFRLDEGPRGEVMLDGKPYSLTK